MSNQIPFNIATNAQQFLAGIAAEEASNLKETVKAKALIDSFITQVETDLRAVYDKYIPNVLVVNIDNFTNIIANAIITKSSKVVDISSESTEIVNRFAKTNSKEYIRLRKVIDGSVKRYHRYLLSNQGSNVNPINTLNTLSLSLFNRTIKIDNAISARVLGFEFSKAIRKVFGNRSVLASIDPGLSNDATFVFFSSSFNAIGTPFRDNVYSKIEKYLRGVFRTDLKSGFKTGTLVNLGHATLINEIGKYVNSPAFAKSLFTVASNKSSLFTKNQLAESAEYFKLNSKIYENSITVSKDFTSPQQGYGVLLSLGVTFSNIEDAVINSERGTKYEGPTARKIGYTKPTALTSSQRKNIAAKLMNMVARGSRNIALGRSSRSIVDYIEESVSGIFNNKKVSAEKSKKIVSSKFKRLNIVPNSSKKLIFKSPLVYNNIARLEDTITLKNTGSLTNLLSILQAAINQRVAQNMGRGSESRILNYRSGRFAESVKVERLSESRQGMISAFYSYMRNPYGTFSEGGRQESPKTRDPKLLISKSIREIAAPIVGARMRAVLV